MVIPRNEGLALVASGDAIEIGLTEPTQGRQFVILTRYDKQRTDHYVAEDSDLDRLSSLTKLWERTNRCLQAPPPASGESPSE